MSIYDVYLYHQIKTNMKNTPNNLPKGTYTHVSTNYVRLEDGIGMCCQNCGKLIANMVTVKNEDIDKTYVIGPDCATFFLNKEVLTEITATLKVKTKQAKKIAELTAQGRPFVLNENGYPCFPPETRSGYMIRY